MKVFPALGIPLCLLSLAITPPALAHNLWLIPADHQPRVGSTVDIGIGFGHSYPADRRGEEMKEDRVGEIRAIDPDGKVVELVKKSAALYQLEVAKAGAYVVSARVKPGFFTTTPDGRKFVDRKGVANAVKCTNFHLEAKTVILAGGVVKGAGRVIGQPLEVIVTKSPAEWKVGGAIPVRVLFEGAPLAGASVKATYAGFEGVVVGEHESAAKVAPHVEAGGAASRGGSEASARGGEAHAKRFPAEAVSDDRGQATLQVNRAGYWMIQLSHRVPYADRATCDESMYNTTFAFEVR